MQATALYEAVWDDPDVNCPFYIQESKKIVECEGCIAETRTDVRFQNKGHKNVVKALYCRSAWWRCPHAATLNAFYDKNERTKEDR